MDVLGSGVGQIVSDNIFVIVRYPPHRCLV